MAPTVESDAGVQGVSTTPPGAWTPTTDPAIRCHSFALDPLLHRRCSALPE